jgi:DNA-binding GntR family transcriptional regulator
MPKTVSEQIADQLRSEILAGLIPPGTRLFQDVEAERLQVSRTPLREAFRQLEAERLVQIIPNRGAIVTQLTAEEVREVFMIRGELEPLAAALAAQRASREDVRAVGSLLEELEYAREHGRHRSLLELNKSFHFMVYEASAMPRLVNIISSLWGPIEAMRATYASEPVTAKHAADEHARLYEAIRDGDRSAAVEVTRQHIETMAAALLAWMEGFPLAERQGRARRGGGGAAATRGGDRETPERHGVDRGPSGTGRAAESSGGSLEARGLPGKAE